jgi:hypothetical protein
VIGWFHLPLSQPTPVPGADVEHHTRGGWVPRTFAFPRALRKWEGLAFENGFLLVGLQAEAGLAAP